MTAKCLPQTAQHTVSGRPTCDTVIAIMAKTHFGCGVGLDDIVFTKIPLLGDADLDGEVTDKDAALVLKQTKEVPRF